MSWIDQKYIGLMSNQFERFQKKTENLYNLRCPECGDSRKNRFKARGYFYERENSWFFKCHNCSYSVSLASFMRKHSPNLYKEYSLETLSGKETQGDNVLDQLYEKPKEEVRGLWPLKCLKKISSLNYNHIAKQYIDGRKIPPNTQYKIFYTPDFTEWVNGMIPDKLKPSEKKDRRIVLPLFDEKKQNLIGFQGRSLDPSNSIRYITISLQESAPKVFGLETVDFKKHVYVTEGPFDSLFIPNSIAVCGSDIVSQLDKLPKIDKSKTTIVFDNERSNTQIIKNIEKSIETGYNVTIWPSGIKQKDINDMVLEGMTAADIKLMIDANTHSGLSAKLALSAYRR